MQGERLDVELEQHRLVVQKAVLQLLMFWMSSRVERDTSSGYVHEPGVPVPQQLPSEHPAPVKMLSMFPALSQHSFWLNALAWLNMSCMLSTADVFQLPMSWLNALAW